MIQVQDLEKSFGGRTLFAEASFQLVKGHRYGIVGANGAGKSTFLRMLMGREEVTSGEIAIPKRARVAFLEQDRFMRDDDAIVTVAMMGDREAWDAMAARDAEIMREHPDAGVLAELEERIAANEGWSLESRAARILEGLGIPTTRHKDPLGSLSGGFKLRVLLAQTLVSRPDILLLDEPTNHLDIVTIRWLESFLMTLDALVVLVSHDHLFLDRVTTDILDVDYETITLFPYHYDRFLVERLAARERREKEIARRQKEKAEKEAFVERFKAKASKARQAQSRVKQIEKIEIETLAESSRGAPLFRLTPARPSGRDVLVVENVKKTYDGRAVLEHVSFRVRRGERVAFLGPNGVGKSTLLKILAGIVTPDSGTVTWGHEVQMGYVPQDHKDALPSEGTPLTVLWSTMPTDGESTVRGALGRALFSGDDVHKPITQLSGGECARVLFACLEAKHPNVLILDEPTNHLDLETIDALAEVLNAYEGTLLVVSHDRWFVERIATRVISLSASGLADYPGTYAEYLQRTGVDHLDRDAPTSEVRADVEKKGTAAGFRAESKERERLKKKLSAEIVTLTAALEAKEREKEALMATMCASDFYTRPPNEVRSVTSRVDTLETEIAATVERWEQAELELANLDAV